MKHIAYLRIASIVTILLCLNASSLHAQNDVSIVTFSKSDGMKVSASPATASGRASSGIPARATASATECPVDAGKLIQISYSLDDSWMVEHLVDPNYPCGQLYWSSVPVGTFTLTSSCASLSPSLTHSYWSTADAADAQAASAGPGPYPELQISWQFNWHYYSATTWRDAAVCPVTAYFNGNPVANTIVQISALRSAFDDPGDETDPCESCDAGAPISLQTGNVSITQTDIRIPGVGGGLQLVRTYHSKVPSVLSGPTLMTSPGLFGAQWRTTYEERVFSSGDVIKYVRSDGSVWTFSPTSTSGIYKLTSPANKAVTLTGGDAGKTVTFQSGERRLFSNISGALVAISDRNSNATYLDYDYLGRLIRVTDPASRHLFFSYSETDSLVTSVTSDVGISVSYTYDAWSRIVSVTKPDKSTLSFEYIDDDVACGGGGGSTESILKIVASPMSVSSPVGGSSLCRALISAVKDSQGKILESHTYDGYGRGLTSSRANGVESMVVTYNWE